MEQWASSSWCCSSRGLPSHPELGRGKSSAGAAQTAAGLSHRNGDLRAAPQEIQRSTVCPDPQLLVVGRACSLSSRENKPNQKQNLWFKRCQQERKAGQGTTTSQAEIFSCVPGDVRSLFVYAWFLTGGVWIIHTGWDYNSSHLSGSLSSKGLTCDFRKSSQNICVFKMRE